VGPRNTLTKGCAILVRISLRWLRALMPLWTTSLTTCNSSPTPNHSGLVSTRAWPWLPPRQSIPFGPERLWGCVVSCSATLVSSYHASWLSHCLLSSSHCAALSSSCRASWLLHRLLSSSHCAAISLCCCTTSLLTAATAAIAATTCIVHRLPVVHWQRKRQHHHHHQWTNGSTIVGMFTSPDNLVLFNLSTVFEV